MRTWSELRSRGGVFVVEIDVGSVDPQGAAIGHRIAGVDGEVDEDLLELARVDQHGLQVGGERAVQLDVLAERATQQLLDVAYDVVDIDDLGLDDLTPGEGEQLVGQVRRPLAGQANLLDVLAGASPNLLAVALLCGVEVGGDESA